MPDSSGHYHLEDIPDSEFEINVDVVVIAIGSGPNRVLLESVEGLELGNKGFIAVNDSTSKTSFYNVYAGGETVSGTSVNLQWTCVEDPDGGFDIQISRDGGQSYVETGTAAPGARTYSWDTTIGSPLDYPNGDTSPVLLRISW